jgi:hypothetical protein
MGLLPPLTLTRRRVPDNNRDFFEYMDPSTNRVLARFFHLATAPYITFPSSSKQSSLGLQSVVDIEDAEILIRSTLARILNRKIEIDKTHG